MSREGLTASAAQLALAIRRLEADRAGADLRNSDPIAIIGMGCRFPGNIKSPADYWRVLSDGSDTISKAPADRWEEARYYDPDPQSPGKMNSCWGGFLSAVDQFDPLLFGISPREAASIDPQQRLLLEVVWEAIWDSGRAPESLAGSRTGVFVGMSNSDYERLLFQDTFAVGPHALSGGYRSVASGRISFLLDLRGPSVSMDTACSSSLTAVHIACQSLRNGESDLALAGGVTLHLLPGHYVGLAKLGMLAPDGRCRTFDASASGFVPSDGCGAMALKRLADALADGDHIYAVIRGTALNQDGRTNVLTAPNGLAQQAVIRAALNNAQVRAADIGYVETHGTGTELGDPIEVEALAEAISSADAGALPCALGAVKTNLGHLEAAAGIAGLMKAALALEQQTIPKNLHFEKLNPHISLDGTRFYLPNTSVAWPRGDRPRFAGVSSFGFSGTNAHVILEEAPRLPARKVMETSGPPYLLPLSARTPEALENLARSYRSFLEEDGKDVPLYDLCHTAASRRSHFEERLAVVAANHEELREALQRPLERTSSSTSGIVFVCSGQGSQWPVMGMSLLRQEPVFRVALEECEQAIQRYAGWSLVEQLSAREGESKLADTEYAQPSIFAIEVALARLWQHWGIRPAAVIGHSAGEVAAAHISGVLSLDEATRVVVTRGRLMQAATGLGKMATVHLPVGDVLRELQSRGAALSIGAINAPESTVISGDSKTVEELLRSWREKGIGCRLLPVNYAFHSAQMRPYSEELVRTLGAVERSPEKIPILSTALGRFAHGKEFDAAYWGQNVLRTVLFGPAAQLAIAQGLTTFIEVGPHPVLLGPCGECLNAETASGILLPSMRRDSEEPNVMYRSLGALYHAGSTIAWDSVYPEIVPRVAAPTYIYQRQRYWLDTRPERHPDDLHPLLGTRLRSPSIRGVVFEMRLDAGSLPYLADHKVEGRVLMPMTAFLEMARRAMKEASGSVRTLSDVTILDALELREEGITIQVVLEDGEFRIFSLHGEEWKLHVTGRATEIGPAVNSRLRPDGDFSLSEPFYRRLVELGFDFGPAFRTLEGIRATPGEAWVHARLQPAEKRGVGQYLFHPSLLDGCLQAVTAAALETIDGTYLPFSLERFETFGAIADEAWAHAVVRATGEAGLEADIEIRDDAGALLARVSGLRLRRRGARVGSKIYKVDWQPSVRRQPQVDAATKFLIVADEPADAEDLAFLLRSRGKDVRLASPDLPWEAGDRADAIVRIGELTAKSTLSLVQEIVLRSSSRPPQLWLITRGAVTIMPGDACPGLDQAPVWGLARTVAMEHPDLRCTRIDLDPDSSDWTLLADEVASSDGEEEIAFRGGRRFVPRLIPTAAPGPTRWTIPARGSIEALALAPVDRRVPAIDEVEVEVEASSLNFRDVLNVLGMYPGNPGAPGIDFCGRVVRGPGVEFQLGDRVMGLAWGCLASFVTTPAALVVRAPKRWSPTDSAAVPNAFLTAYHCLIRIGRLQKGETVLIHAGTGGVGIAAIQIAQRAGATIFATAGTPEKRAMLHSLGVTHAFSSRTLDFAHEILSLTGGKGVHLVLNSLAGDFIAAGFAALAPAGRFVEIGKNQIWTSERVARLGKPVDYFVVDLAEVIESRPEEIQADLLALRGDFESGTLQPLPVKVFEFDDAPSAFRHMAQAKHVGKIVLRHSTGLRVTPDASYLVTGGLGAMGLEVARWLVALGARHLILVGRRAPSVQTLKAIEELRASGASVEVRAADVAQRAEIEAVFQETKGSLPPLAGVVHAAGVLDDGVILQQTAERLDRVMRPKVRGAWNLHELTAEMPLDFFILCSSIASVTGSPGQAGYAAGNAFMDALAHYRRAKGLPAMSLNWGAWANAGMAARTNDDGRRLSLACVQPMAAEECFRQLEQASTCGHPQLVIADVDWTRLQPPPRLISQLLRKSAAPNPEPTASDILDRIDAAPRGNRRRILSAYLCDTARRILGLSSSLRIDERRPLTQLGLDSLMAVEFRNQLVADLKRPLNATLLFDHPTIGALADSLDPSDGAASARPDPILAQVTDLSDDEAEALLRLELEQSS